MMENKKELLNVRDIVVEFRSKRKKNIAVKNVSFDIYNGEVFGLVGESGSGKTTIGRAIVGVQNLKDGAIYLDNQIIAGIPTRLFKLNKQITKSLKEMNIKINSILSLFSEFIDIIEFKMIKSEISLEDEKKLNRNLNYLEEKNKILILLISNNLNYINKIITNFDRINKFIFNINSYIPELPKELENAIISKNNETKNFVVIIKRKLVESYDNFLKILELLENLKNSEKKSAKNSENTLVKILENIKTVSEIFRELKKDYNILMNLEKENLILSAPLKKRNKYLQKYYDLVFVNRDDFYIEINKQLNLLLNSNISDNSEIEKLNIHLNDFWSKSNINLKSIRKIFKLIESKKYSQEEVKKLLNTLKNTEFEIDFKKFLVNNQNVDYLELKKFKKEFNYITKIIKNNVIKDEETIKAYLEWKPEKQLIFDENREKILEFIEFLELPSIDEIVNNSFFFRKRTKKERKMNRKNTQMIFQDPGSSLNDKMSVSEILSEGLNNFKFMFNSKEEKEFFVDNYNKNNNTNLTIKDIKSSDVKNKIILDLIKSVGLLDEHLSRYPHEFSGGQKQRIGIARALSLKPKIIVADEPISALDVSIRSQVLNLFKRFREEYNLTYLFITHDLSVVKYFADRIAVIYQGKIVELAEAIELFANPLHPYTQSLLSAIPLPDPNLSKNRKLKVYNPSIEHYDYQIDVPYFKEIKKGHYIYANEREIKNVKKELFKK